MRKRFLNALLLGAVLLSTGAVTSCKDYDDDINNLQSQIDKLAEVDKLKADIEQLNTAVANAKSEAIAEANKALQDALKNQEDKNKLTDEKLADLEKAVKAAQADATKAQQDLKTAEANLKELIDKKADKTALAEAERKILEAKAAADEANAAAATAQATADAAQGDATQALADAAQALKDAKAANDALKGKADKADLKAAEDRIKDLETFIENLQIAEDNKTLSKIIDDVIVEKVGAYTGTSTLAAEVEALRAAVFSVGEDDQTLINNLEDLKNRLAELEKKAASMNIVSTMVTDIQLYPAQNYDNDVVFMQTQAVASYKWYTKIDAKDITAAPTEQIEFKKDAYEIGDDEILVRVSPVNATLDAKNIKFINTKGQDLEGVVEVADVKKFDGLLTRAAQSYETGLWVVKIAPVKGEKGFDVDAFKDAVAKDNSHILYSIAVKDLTYTESKKEGEEEKEVDVDRYVTSEYDLAFMLGNEPQAYDFNVNNKSINDIFNRCSSYSKDVATAKPSAQELDWAGKASHKVELTGDKKNVADRQNPAEDRSGKDLIEAVMGEDGAVINISFDNKIKGFFVTLDEKFAQNDDELKAWNSYTYEGVGFNDGKAVKQNATLINGNNGTIKITDLKGASVDIIGFRVYAVNLDGTLTDPDGRAFYVAVKTKAPKEVEAKIDVACKLNETTGNYIFESKPVAIADLFVDKDGNKMTLDEIKKLVYTQTSNWKAVAKDADGKEPIFDVVFLDKDGKPLEDVGITTFKYALEHGLASVKFVMNQPNLFIDGATYSQYANFINNVGDAEDTIMKLTVTTTKVMPTDSDKFNYISSQNKFQWVTPVDLAGVPSDYTVADYRKGATLSLNNVFTNGRNGLGSAPSKNYFTFNIVDGEFVKNPKTEKDNAWVAADKSVKPANWDATAKELFKYDILAANSQDNNENLVDNETAHAINTSYTYYNISKHLAADGKTYEIGDWNVDATFVKTTTNGVENEKAEIVYCSWTKGFEEQKDAKSLWAKNNTVKWKGNNNEITLDLTTVEVKIAADARIPSTLINTVKGKKLGELIANNLLKVVNIKPLKGSNGVEDNPYYSPAFNTADYSKVILTPTQTEQPPVGTENENLLFTVMDCFHRTFDIELPIAIVDGTK